MGFKCESDVSLYVYILTSSDKWGPRMLIWSEGRGDTAGDQVKGASYAVRLKNRCTAA